MIKLDGGDDAGSKRASASADGGPQPGGSLSLVTLSLYVFYRVCPFDIAF